MTEQDEKPFLWVYAPSKCVSPEKYDQQFGHQGLCELECVLYYFYLLLFVPNLNSQAKLLKSQTPMSQVIKALCRGLTCHGWCCKNFTLTQPRSFEKSSWNCLYEGRERRLFVALMMCHHRQMASWEIREKTQQLSNALPLLGKLGWQGLRGGIFF